MATERIHATAVAIDGQAVLVMGPSGSGKSDLAIRLIDRGATLVSDDYCEITGDASHVVVSPPDNIAGQIEVRGIGIVKLPHDRSVPAALVVRLVPDDTPIERYPLDKEKILVGPCRLPMVPIHPFEDSAPVKVEWALHAIVAGMTGAP